MLKVVSPKRTVYEEWLNTQVRFDLGFAQIYHHYHRFPGSSEASKHSTLEIDLTQGLDAIHAGFSKDCRYEIRRAEEKDLFGIQCWGTSSLTATVAKEFLEDCRAFVTRKGVEVLNFPRIEAALRSREFHLSRCQGADQTFRQWHLYLVGSDTLLLLNSITWLTDAPVSGLSSAVGRANRLLHWRDIQFARDSGLSYYDFGGYYVPEDGSPKASISRFKRQFCDRIVEKYSWVSIGGVKALARQVKSSFSPSAWGSKRSVS